MSFKKDFGNPTSSAPKKTSSTSLAGFNFKQLEEDDDDSFLMYTGKYEKPAEDIQKAQKKSHERTPSTSSVSSTTSSIAEESILPLKANLEGTVDNVKVSLKPTSFFSTETTSSSLRTAALAKLETSKDMFSGLRGKITDKISKTIEEFSSDFSSNSSPGKEKSKHLTPNKNISNEPAEKEIGLVYHSTSATLDPVSKSSIFHEFQDESFLPLAHSESPLSSTGIASPSVKDTAANTPLKNEAELHNKTVSNKPSSDCVKAHPLDNIDDEVDDYPENEFTKDNKKDANDSSECSPHYTKTSTSIPVSESLSYEPEDFRGNPSAFEDTQLSSKVKDKSPMKRAESKSSILATISNISSNNNALSLEEQSKIGSIAQVPHVSKQSEKNSMEDKSTPVSSKSTTNLILQTIKNLEVWALSYQKMITIVVVLFTYLIIPLPSYVSGFIMGTLLASLGWAFYMWLMRKPTICEPAMPPPTNELSLVPELRMTVDGEEFLFKGWMNELAEYNADDYHINKTHSIFVSLEGSHLRLQKSKNAIPKRALWDEVLPKPHFIHQRHFDLPGARVFLLPHGLVKKRVWSKKYPICVALADRNSNADVKLRHIASEPFIVEKNAKISDLGFEFATEEKCGQNVLYLFARTGREKEEWFKRLLAAASSKPLANHVLEMKRVLAKSSIAGKKSADSVGKHKRQGSGDSTNSFSTEGLPESSSQKIESLDLLAFAHYMGRLMPSGALSGPSSPAHNSTSKDTSKNSVSKDTNKDSPSKDIIETKVLNTGASIFNDSQMFWINALIGRCFFDFLRDKWWISKVQEKLQRKLSKIHVPYFIEELQVTGINMGCEMPSIRHAGKPYMDERGFWVNLDLTYAGGFQMTIETKINLMKLKKTHHLLKQSGHSADNLKSPITDSDEEDSAESSTDEEEEAPSNSEDNSSGGGASKKFLRYLGKITRSKYFQQATEYGVIKRAMENVSNTPLTLAVTVISLVGKLAVNIPPPPSDRLWYGFRGNPHLRLSAKPQVGERAVTITHIVEWIEKKLAVEFQRVFVMPNMDDLIIPILVPGEMNDSAMTRSASV